MELRSANYVNDNTEAHVKEPNKEHGKDHAGETSESHGRDQDEEAREEAHQPRGATSSLQIPPVQAPGSREGSKKECHQDGPRSTKMRPVDREAMIMPEWLTHRYHQEERIDETDQDQQYCRVTDQEARDEYYSSTPDVLTKDDGGTDADERSRRELINLQYEDQGMQIPYPEVRTALRGLNSGTMVTLEELVPLGYPHERTYKTAREPHCRSTPDRLTKPMTEDKFRTYQGQIYGTSRRRTEKIWRLVTPWSERDLAHLPAM
jgi:hypothetical protein